MDAIGMGYEEDNKVSALVDFSSPYLALMLATPQLDHCLDVALFRDVLFTASLALNKEAARRDTKVW
jgi:hypothetical protein